jgi:hypothetical protein
MSAFGACVGTGNTGNLGAGKAANEKKPLFAVRPKNITFNVKPKKDSIPEEETDTIVANDDGTSNSSNAVTGLASLCATYDDDSSD